MFLDRNKRDGKFMLLFGWQQRQFFSLQSTESVGDLGIEGL